MTYDQFWEESPYLVIAYRKAYRLKREAENEQAWLEGLYNYHALATALSNAFRKSGQKIHNYIEKPIDIFPLTEREKKRRKEIENKKMQDAMKAMMRKQQAKKKKGENNG